MPILDRRQFLKGAAALALLPAPAGASDEAPLRERAARKGLFYGVAVKGRDLSRDALYSQAVVREAGMLVPEWETKRDRIERMRGTLDFLAPDRLSAFARDYGMLFRGHPLVWHEGNPMWLEWRLEEKADESLLTGYVGAVAGHFRGRVHSWTVVNEAVDPRSGRPDGLRDSFWLKAFGEHYLDLAFQAARSADPQALLVYNDYGLHEASEVAEARRRAVLRLLQGLKARGVPVDALGVQGHLRAYGEPFDARVFARFLNEVAGLGLKLMVTELDVADDGGPDDVAERDRAAAELTRRYVDAMLARPETLGVVTWGLSDRYSWLALGPARGTGRRGRTRDEGEEATAPQPLRPLPLDVQLRRKPMWRALADCFDAAARRPAG